MSQTLQFISHIVHTPIAAFTILLFVCLFIPPWFERLGLPGLVGLLLAGMILGSGGLGLLNPKSETIKLLSDIGKLYLMFVAGLEIDLEQFRQKKNRSLGYGFATFFFPLVVGALIGRVFGFGWNSSILIGSLFASHTLLGYPIVKRLGVGTNEAVIVSIGATIFTDISALFVLAICVSIHGGEFSLFSLSVQLGSLAIYSALVLFGFDWAGKEYFRRTGDDEGNQFLFVLLAIFLAAVGAQIIHVEQIVGAFLAGLAVNDVVGRSPVKEKVEFVGSVLFIPFFFVGMGLLLDIPVFIETLTNNLGLTIAIVLGLISSKLLAAVSAKLLYRYSWNETIVMWSLSIPQVAATLAAALVGLQTGLINEVVFNTIIVLMLVTSVLGPLLTARFAPKLHSLEPIYAEQDKASIWWEESDAGLEQLPSGFKAIVPVANPVTERYLIEIAALLARHESGMIIPLSITQTSVHLPELEFNLAIQKSRRLLKQAEQISTEFEVKSQPTLRIVEDVATGILRTAREQEASLIVMGWSEQMGLRSPFRAVRAAQSRLFGNLIDSVLWSAHCPVAVMRLLDEPINIKRLLVPVKNLSPQTIRTIHFAQLLADTNNGSVTLLHVCPEQITPEEIEVFKYKFTSHLDSSSIRVDSEVKIIPSNSISQTILQETALVDLIVWRSLRRRTAGGLMISDIPHQVIDKLACSMVLFGEPHA
ncbi:MAG: cation:proton antiporter [Cyanobacteria bacterium P01_G01_bin.39]